MALKQVERSATTAFSPSRPLIATGTMAGAIDLAVSTSAAVEIFHVDFGSDDINLPLKGGAPTSEPFNRLSWGATASDTAAYPLGILAGGLVDGCVSLWNPAKIIGEVESEGDDSLITKLQKHTAAVMGLEFNKLSPNLLASGGEEGELCIWDLSNPSAPSLYPGSKGGGNEGAISYLAWNNKVQHILASTTQSGTAVVWDLKRQKAVIRVRDPNMRQKRCSMIQWSPDVANQMIVSYDDDRSPALQIWDLRNTISPFRELHGHTKGVLSMGWCPFDGALVVSSGKDNRTICWDSLSGEMLCELPASSNWNFNVQWSTTVPGILSTSSFDGYVRIQNIEHGSAIGEPEGIFDVVEKPRGGMKRAPKWMKRPASVSFGFGGKLVSSFGNEVKLRKVVTEEDLVKRSTEFEAAVRGEERQTMKAFCAQKTETTQTGEEKETWIFLQVLFEDDARRQLLSHLDFASALAMTAENGEHDAGTVGADQTPSSTMMAEIPEAAAPSAEQVGVGGLASGLGSLDIGDEIDDGEAFFDRLDPPQSPNASAFSEPAKGLETSAHGEGQVSDPVKVKDADQDEDDEDSEYESAIQRALVVGNYEAAVQACMKANRLADALVLASIGGTSLWSKTQNEYMNRSRRTYMKVVSAVVNNNLKSLVASRPLRLWKETLALLCTYARSDDWTGLCDLLGDKLAQSRENHAAVLCYICAGNIDRAVQLWSCSLGGVEPSYRPVGALQDIMEKAVVLGLATGRKRAGASLAKLVGAYAELLASQGQLNTALEYLKLIPDEQSTQELAVLRERIYHSIQQGSDRMVEQAQFNQFEVQQPQSSVQREVVQPVQHSPLPQLAMPDPNTQINQPPMPQQNVPTHMYGSASTFIPRAQPLQPVQPVQQVQQVQPVQSVPAARSMQLPAQSQFYTPYPAPVSPQQKYMQPQQLQPTMMMPTPPMAPPVPTLAPNQFIPAPPPPIPLLPQQEHHQLGTAVTSAAPGTPKAPLTMQDGPPPTVQTADTSLVADDLKPVVGTLTRLFNDTTAAGGGLGANPMKKREIDDNSKKLGMLFTKINSSDVSSNVGSKLKQLCQALDAGDYNSALQLQVALTTSDWDECSGWLMALKRMIKQRQALGR